MEIKKTGYHYFDGGSSRGLPQAAQEALPDFSRTISCTLWLSAGCRTKQSLAAT
jgi:hypothetical protein